MRKRKGNQEMLWVADLRRTAICVSTYQGDEKRTSAITVQEPLHLLNQQKLRPGKAAQKLGTDMQMGELK